MSNRKTLDANCDGGIFCEVEGHLKNTSYGNGRFRFSHIPLTTGQRKTLRERRDTAHNNPKEVSADAQ